MKYWVPTEEDLANARILYEEEKIDPLTLEKMFEKGVYCVLSAAESYRKLKILHGELVESGLDTPESIQMNRRKLKKILSKTRFPQTKIKRVIGFSLWWPGAMLPRRIIEDAGSDRINGFSLRNQLAEEAPGMGYKCASLFMGMSGYENLVPIDLWALRFLSARGYHVKIPDYETNGGLRKKQFLRCEKLFSNIARRYAVNPTVFHRALWAKYSSWNTNSRK